MSDGSGKQMKNKIIILILISIAVFLMCFELEKPSLTYDEFDESNIASSFTLANPLGNSDDPIAERLPLMITAPFLHIFKNRLITSRLISIIFAVLTILTAYILVKTLYNDGVALMTTAFMSVSSYFLGFARFGFTQGDSLYTLLFTLSILLFVKFIKTDNPNFLLLTGVATGLTIASKMIGGILLPIFLLYAVFSNKLGLDKFRKLKLQFVTKLNILFVMMIVGLVLFQLIGFVVISKNPIGLINDIRNPGDEALRAAANEKLGSIVAEINNFSERFSLAVIAVIIVSYIIFLRKLKLRKNDVNSCINMVLFSIIFTFLGTPTNFSRLNMMMTTFAANFARFGSAGGPSMIQKIISWAGYFSYVAIIKLLVPMGIVFFISILYFITKKKKSAEKFIVSVFFIYLSATSIIDWRQVYFLMPLVVIIYLFISKMLYDIYLHFRSRNKVISFSIIILIVGLFAISAVQSAVVMPYFTLTGHSILDDKYIGTTNIIKLDPCEGAKEFSGWARANLKPGSDMISYNFCETVFEHYNDGYLNYIWRKNGEPFYLYEDKYVLFSKRFINRFDSPFLFELVEKEKEITAQAEKNCERVYVLKNLDIEVLSLYKC